MKSNNQDLEQYRTTPWSCKDDGNNGVFHVPFQSYLLKVICSDGGGWDHVSVSMEKRTPNWDQMCFIKNLFFTEDETVIQFHPKKEHYVNFHPHCLHLWRKQGIEIELPPSIFVGPQL